MGNERSKGLREEVGQGYLNLLDSVRHSFEQAAWGQEGSGNLADDFYRWAGAPEDASKAMDAAALSGSFEPSAEDWKEFEAWIDGKQAGRTEREIEEELERNGPELGE